jgi:hypothetical protein
VVYISPSSVQLRTFINQPGTDTSDKILFADYMSNIAVPERYENYTNEVTHVIAWGAGPAGAQAYQTATDTERETRSRWRHREYSFNAGNISDSTALQEIARRELNARRPVRRFSCELLDVSPNAIYGYHWRHGDKVKVSNEGQLYTGIVRNVELSWKEEGIYPETRGTETFRARFEFQDMAGGGGVVA